MFNQIVTVILLHKLFTQGLTFYQISPALATLTLYSIDTHFHASTTDSFLKTLWEGEIIHNEQFLPFPQCFPLNRKTVSQFVHIFGIISVFPAEFEKPKFSMSGKRVQEEGF